MILAFSFCQDVWKSGTNMLTQSWGFRPCEETLTSFTSCSMACTMFA